MRMQETKEHTARILRYAQDDFSGPATVPSRIRASWRRSLDMHGIHPTDSIAASVLSAAELRERQGRTESLLRIADPYITALRQEFARLDYCVLLTDETGATLAARNCAIRESELEHMRLFTGACWPESSVGTGGIGTAIHDKAPILVHQSEHFSSQIINMSCSAAPIFNLDDELVGVLNATGLHRSQDRHDQRLIYNLILKTATTIENAWFLDHSQDAWVVECSDTPGFFTRTSDPMIAFDDSGRVIAGNRAAQNGLLRESSGDGASIEALFGLRAETLIDSACDRPGGLQRLGSTSGDAIYYGRLRAPRRTGTTGAKRAATKKTLARHKTGGLADMVSADPQVAASIARLRRVIDGRLPILLLGETGSGKEILARAVHEESRRRDQPFVAINCAAIPETLIESELFGYKAGAFTGAKSKGGKGKLLQANGGTLFLDEIGDMPAALQTRLLRVLSEGEVLPLGATQAERVDLNVICATHRDLAALVDDGRFREDLYYRLNAATFRLPSLRERTDSEEIIKRILAEEARQAERGALHLTRRALAFAVGCPWPGNLRQLRNVIRYAVAVSDGAIIDLAHFPPDLVQSPPAAADWSQPRPDQPPMSSDAESKAPSERQRLIGALRHHDWQVTAAAQALGVARATLYRRMKRLNIVSPNRADAARDAPAAEPLATQRQAYP